MFADMGCYQRTPPLLHSLFLMIFFSLFFVDFSGGGGISFPLFLLLHFSCFLHFAKFIRELEREEARAAREKEKEMESLRDHYLGKKKVKKKIVKPSEKFSKIFQFDWDASEDTSRDANPLYSQRAQVGLGVSGSGGEEGGACALRFLLVPIELCVVA